jgi:hypothetical protein
MSYASDQFLVVEETFDPIDDNSNLTAISVKVADIVEASNLVVSVTNTYFAGIDCYSFHMYDNSAHNDPFRHRPDIVTPLKTQDDCTVDVEVINDDPMAKQQQEYARNIKCIDAMDADKKGKKIQKELFKDKPCRIKVKEKSKP